MIHTGTFAGPRLAGLLIRGDLSLTVILEVRHLSITDVEESMGIQHLKMGSLEQYAPAPRAKSFHGWYAAEPEIQLPGKHIQGTSNSNSLGIMPKRSSSDCETSLVTKVVFNVQIGFPLGKIRLDYA